MPSKWADIRSTASTIAGSITYNRLADLNFSMATRTAIPRSQYLEDALGARLIRLGNFHERHDELLSPSDLWGHAYPIPTTPPHNSLPGGARP